MHWFFFFFFSPNQTYSSKHGLWEWNKPISNISVWGICGSLHSRGGCMKAGAVWSGQSNFEVFETSERSQAAMFLGLSTSLNYGALSLGPEMSKGFFRSQVSTAKLHSGAIRLPHITRRLRWKRAPNALPDGLTVREGPDMKERM